jgi:DNA-binding HxlR family transcriptional regulator
VKYGQFCPIAKASEVLGERWMLLVVRELVSGATRYRDLQRGLGRISPSVLSSRIKTLLEHGIVERVQSDSEHGEYRLTRAGIDLAPIIDSIGGWGQRWVRSRMTRDELDVELLMLTVQRNFDASAFPKDHAVIAFVFSDLHRPMRRWWLLIDEGHTELCSQPPGRTEDFTVTCRLRTLTEVYTGDTTIDAVVEARRLETKGPANLVRSMPRWLRVQGTPRTL